MQRLSQVLILALAAWTVQAEETADRGAYLATAAGCVTCHTDIENDGAAWAGGHALETPYGIFYTPNITPDPETGIGNWTTDEFVTALREGTGPDGRHYYPSFPFPSYAGMTEADARDMFAYMQTLEPVSQPNRPHELSWYVPGRWSMRFWQALFSPWNYAESQYSDPVIERGAYLVRHLGHCGECHTPRNLFGALDTARELSGSPKGSTGGGAPDITPDPDNGIGQWDEDELLFFLELGMTPDGDFAGGSMTAVVDEHTSLLTEADRLAITLFLRQIPAQ
ncbi:MAG: c-type cytochrome [Gammaproteobacteria bacterium]